MFQWLTVARNALWILGAAVLLAQLSYASWLAREQNRPLRLILSAPGPKRRLWLGLALIAAGLTLTAATLWEQLIWTAFTLFTLINLWRVGR